MKYIEEYLKDIIKVKPLGKLTTKEDELDGMSGEMVYIDGKCSNIFISHADYANWLEKQGEKETDEWKEGNIIRHGGILALVIRGRRVMKSNGEIFTVQYPDEWVKAETKERKHFFEELEKQGGKPQGKTALLFAKMKDAGYEWDSNRKELIKIEQKLSNSAKIGMDEESKWTEEDEERLQSCIIALQGKGLMGGVDTMNSKWLKSLKQRIYVSSAKTCKNDTLLDLLNKMPSYITVDGLDYHFVLKKIGVYIAYYECEGEEGRDKIIFWMAGDPVDLLTAMLEKLKEEGLLE